MTYWYWSFHPIIVPLSYKVVELTLLVKVYQRHPYLSSQHSSKVLQKYVMRKAMGMALQHQLLDSHPSVMHWIAFQMLKALYSTSKSHYLQWRKNITLYVASNSSHEVIDSHGNSDIDLQVSAKMDWLLNDVLEREGFSYIYILSNMFMRVFKANPLKSPFSLKSCNTVLVIWDIVFPSAGGKRMAPILPMRWGSLAWSSLRSLRYSMSSWWPIWLHWCH